MIVKTEEDMAFASARLLEKCVMCNDWILSLQNLSDKSCDPLCVHCEKDIGKKK